MSVPSRLHEVVPPRPGVQTVHILGQLPALFGRLQPTEAPRRDQPTQGRLPLLVGEVV